ncbi:unnamed protein product [Peronospora belbahrii]|uniref:Jacalin-type lectin domain-containing protein n=1 Tax=Peronospora belbahrii TaxID=622444 RepID=A0ABN8D0A0_9STRA|nr:unnamed protein product [Peronospora belbahrii]
MQLFAVLQAFVLLFIVSIHGVILEEDIQLSKAFGGSGGTAFSDINLVEFGQRASSIEISAKNRVTSVTLRRDRPTKRVLSHGGSGGTSQSLSLADGEYVNSMEIYWAKKGFSSRIFYLQLSTNAGNSIAVGRKTNNNSTITAPNGFQLGGFFGRSDSELDQLGLIWTRINATAAALNDTMGTAWYGNRIRNWVGPTIGDATDSACYRRREIFGSGKSCPIGYSANGISCLAQCPISYPVNCFEQCIPQNGDCLVEILGKSASVISAAFSAVTAGIFDTLFTSFKSAKKSFVCAANIIGVVKSLIHYLRLQRTMAPEGTTEEMLIVAYHSDAVLFAMPIAVANCLGIRVAGKVVFANVVYVIVENIVKQTIINGDQILSSANSVFAFLQNSSIINSVDESTVHELQVLLDSKTTCGYQLKNITDHITATVSEIRNKTLTATTDDIRVEISNSPLVLRDIPTATNNCMRELMATKSLKTAFETRDLIRKTLGTIVDQLIETNKTDMGHFVAEGDQALQTANTVLTVLGGMDPTGIASMLSQFVQPICGPTAFVGEIDDGTLYDALGLETMDGAFKGSYGTWMKEGDGVMDLIFESMDTEDVTVAIYSGGEEYKEVDVPAGSSITLAENISSLHDKTLYLDRWRRTVLGIPSSAGGSLKMWVPRSSQGGHLTMHVRINVS